MYHDNKLIVFHIFCKRSMPNWKYFRASEVPYQSYHWWSSCQSHVFRLREKQSLLKRLGKFQFSPEEGSHVYHVQNKAISPFATHHNDVIMGTMASQITSLTIVYPTVYSGADRRKHQSSASLAFVQGIHRRPVNSPHKCLVTQKMFPFDDVIVRYMYIHGNDRRLWGNTASVHLRRLRWATWEGNWPASFHAIWRE